MAPGFTGTSYQAAPTANPTTAPRPKRSTRFLTQLECGVFKGWLRSGVAMEWSRVTMHHTPTLAFAPTSRKRNQLKNLGQSMGFIDPKTLVHGTEYIDEDLFSWVVREIDMKEHHRRRSLHPYSQIPIFHPSAVTRFAKNRADIPAKSDPLIAEPESMLRVSSTRISILALERRQCSLDIIERQLVEP
ncbi:hypothetical protein QAD02_022547 [Eretmocerus hayati]|uniref:Uncharacterized protein n=1 Tax=Eretmocerus hayati TaxID=131215 RepID=A0ACC2PTF4_9HYME|nr:hypothetical protein QAD02_022547 [Eretmocerus hayati]